MHLPAPIAAQLEWSLTDQTPTRPDNIATPIPLLSPQSMHRLNFYCGIRVENSNSLLKITDGPCELNGKE